ncbi:putative tricarboxylic transport membrane protein [Nocardioides sp. BE266]|uniref:tripartite tricarboxylate transporter permease n=1 Tax=Nocardioides sp. BE266 TaxID=2817725 RepID=UPI00285DE8BA|nr:tripartite tricarboxylate transporter permease [Nocardioides sp. BE266]MDR7254196.1 putative tricarboxylic transport membrane protein [Nocardioides sp. BE266]
MDFSGILVGVETTLTPSNLLFVLIGVLVGMVIGVIPGLGPTATIALLLPLTYGLDPATAVIMLAGIYYGSMYGGTITSVLLHLPGEAASVVTTFDGYQMAKQGRAGPALGIAAIGSFIGGLASVAGLVLVAPLMAGFALRFGPPEFTVLALLGIVLAAYLASRRFAAALAMAACGLVLATVGQDSIEGSPRFTFGSLKLLNGLDFVAVAMGLFGLGELLHTLDRSRRGTGEVIPVGHVMPSRDELRQCRGPIARGSVIGFVLGLLPGGGGMVASLSSYAVEKRRSRTPERFGKGAIEGVAGPETANNAGSQSSFIPLLTLGLPPNPVLALILGALLIQGITPGPRLIEDHPDIFWGVIASMLVGNVILLALNLPLVRVFIRILDIRVAILVALAVVVTMLGVFSINNSIFDLWVVLAFGLVGYGMRKVGFEPGPLVLAFVLGALLEPAARQSLLLSGGDLTVFVTRPISGSMLALAALVAIVSVVAARRRRALLADLPVDESEPSAVEDKEEAR